MPVIVKYIVEDNHFLPSKCIIKVIYRNIWVINCLIYIYFVMYIRYIYIVYKIKKTKAKVKRNQFKINDLIVKHTR